MSDVCRAKVWHDAETLTLYARQSMTMLVVGVSLFVGVHLVPSAPALRNALRQRLGNNGYRGLFALTSAVGFVLLIVGMGQAPFVTVWNPPLWGRYVALYVMPLALTLFVAAYMPTNLKRLTRHPMLWGVAIWAAVHLLANGDLASLILFGSFGGFALFDMVSANRRGAELSTRAVPYWQDLLVVLVGAVVYVAVLYGHAWLFGVPALLS